MSTSSMTTSTSEYSTEEDQTISKEGLQKLTQDELIHEVESLRKVNSQLKCRLLGVNELARLLQEKTISIETLQDKNRRLELAVVRLENRCSNMEKKQKSQQFTSLPAATATNISIGSNSSKGSGTSQSPFIPGPSKQILESLMKQNTELKKTIDGLTKKGPTSYREAVVGD